MFYQDRIDATLGFGDVLKGFVLTAPSLVEPLSVTNYNIEVEHPAYCVVLSPCCSIGNNVITLSPLLKVRSSFFDNPYFEEDLTRLNRKMLPQQAVSPFIWEKKLSEEERQRRILEGEAYAFIELFIFERHSFFKKYIVHLKGKDNFETNYYMIDFKNQYKINCEKIRSATEAPINSKCLQLTIETRSELRDKISFYYSRVPVEDEVVND